MILNNNNKIMSLHQRRQRKVPMTTLRQKRVKTNEKQLNDDLPQDFDPLELQTEDLAISKFRKKSFKANKFTINQKIAIGCSFMDLAKELRSKRTLVEENNDLRKKLEHISSSKMRKNQSMTKKMSGQFQKELYWSGNQSYMISGIKLQYQKMKENYIKKSDDYELLLKSADISYSMELMNYIQALEVENNLLVKTLENKFKKNQKEPYNQENAMTVILNLRERLVSYQDRMIKLKGRLKAHKNQNKDLRTKVNFLEKLIIQKDNNQHSANRTAKRAQKQKEQFQIKFQNLEKQIKNMEKQYQTTIQELKKIHQKKLTEAHEQEAENKKSQQEHFLRVQRENIYLNNLISSWKEEKTQTNEIKKERTNSKNKIEKSANLPMDNQTIIENNPIANNLAEHIHHFAQHEHSKQTSQAHIERTTPYTADKKNSENAVKNRRVPLYQIELIIDYARFVLIAQDLDIQWLVKQFQNNDDEADQWDQEYINMKQVRILCQKDLQLNKEDALLLARYIIEYSDTEHVYTDDINQHNRAIVKSIVRNLFGSYPIFKDKKEQFQKILIENKSKLEFTLLNTTKGGIIGKDKFKDLLQSLNLSNIPGFTTYCTAKIAIKSQSLDKMQFSYLYSLNSGQQ